MSPTVLALSLFTAVLLVFVVVATATTVRADARRNAVFAARWRRSLAVEARRESLRNRPHPRTSASRPADRGAA